MTTSKHFVIGVLALQGAFREHLIFFQNVLKQYDEYSKYALSFIEVKTKEQLESCNSLVIPGGESTSISYIAERTGLLEPLLEFVSDDSKSVWGTCAGLIFLARQLKGGKKNQHILGGLDIEVKRNAFGRQLNSFETHLDFSSFIPGVKEFPTVFIRAPVISKILNDTEDEPVDDEPIIISSNTYRNPSPVDVLYTLHDYNQTDLIVAVRQGNKLGTSFHPELGDDVRFHKWFIDEFVLLSETST
jgi:5'-phosphate synthase pdxT subunit